MLLMSIFLRLFFLSETNDRLYYLFSTMRLSLIG